VRRLMPMLLPPNQFLFILQGEAEAYCAALDAAGLVDGVVSNDSDCLCYGARKGADTIIVTTGSVFTQVNLTLRFFKNCYF